jgi:hypothetical protein
LGSKLVYVVKYKKYYIAYLVLNFNYIGVLGERYI